MRIGMAGGANFVGRCTYTTLAAVRDELGEI
jgi:hypothetical protein